MTLVAGLCIPESLLASNNLISIPGGRFKMGCKSCGLSDALPVHEVEVSSFLLQSTPVTNEEFRKFTGDTGYVSGAETSPDPSEYPNIPANLLVPGSAVFTPEKTVAKAGILTRPLDWWSYIPGASWKHPEGAKSTTSGRETHPAVHVNFNDAVAYCRHFNMRLPTEAEFEYAARGGLEGKKYAWGDTLKPNGRWMANTWQGSFPRQNSKQDGYAGTSPVGSFPPNGFGLYDMAGNVWQWTSDWYRPDTYREDARRGVVKDPRGPDSSYDPAESGTLKKVQRGGSFLCSDEYCTRYLVGSRGKGEPGSAGSNTGFRCAKDHHQRRHG
ncbi:formylglycine-generating enzyme family protein [bacterium]|nr:formylglycine-generating enzyme family protein [bacterium]